MSRKSQEKKWRESARRARRPEHKRHFLRLAHYEKLCGSIESCTNCQLSNKRVNAVPLDQPNPVPIAFVGEAPGANEDQNGVPFVGRSGKLLDSILEDVGMPRSEVAVLNTVACRPPKNRDPLKIETEACLPNYEAQLNFSGAWIVVPMGNKAMGQIFPGKKISQQRGKPIWKQGRIYVPTYHPAYILRNPRNRQLLVNDIQLAVKIYRGDKWWPPHVKAVTKSGTKADLDLAYTLEHQGWAHTHSHRLEDEIVIVRDTEVVVPHRYHKVTQYTVEELIRIGELGKGPRLTLGELSAIHLVKRLGGTVVQ